MYILYSHYWYFLPISRHLTPPVQKCASISGRKIMKYHFSPMKTQHSLIERYDSYLSKNVFINFLNLVKKKLSSNIFSKRIGNGKMSASRNAAVEYKKIRNLQTQHVFKKLNTCIKVTATLGL